MRFEPSGEIQDESDVFLSQDFLDPVGILENPASSVVQDRRDAKEILAIMGSWVNQVLQLTWTLSFCHVTCYHPAAVQSGWEKNRTMVDCIFSGVAIDCIIVG